MSAPARSLALALAALLAAACAHPAGRDDGKGGAAPSAARGPSSGGADGGATAPSSAAARPAGAPPVAADDAFRAAQPAALERPLRFDAPVPVERKLSNGLRVLAVENHALPLVTVLLVVPAGVDRERPGQAGVAGLTAAAITEGTLHRSATELAIAIEDLAARLDAAAGLEATTVQLSCLAEALEPGLDLLADVATTPAFREEDVARMKGVHLTDLELKRGRPAALARDEAARLVFGERHPWGQPAGGTPASVRALKRTDLAAFHAANYRPDGAVLVVAGDVAADRAAELLEARFGRWRAKAAPSPRAEPRPGAPGRIVSLVDRPGASQSQVWVVGPLFGASDPDHVPLRVGNYALGGLFSSRLNLNLREAKGYSYGVRSSVDLHRSTGIFVAAGGIVGASTAPAVTEYERELSRFAEGGITPAELATAKRAYVRALPSALATNDGVARAIANLTITGLPLDWYRVLPAKVEATTAEDVARVARRWVTPARWPVVVVGPRAQVEAPLRELGLGAVQARPGDGSPP